MGIVDVMALRVVSVGPQASVRDAIGRMMSENVGSVAVCDGPRLVGIFTERDVLRLAGGDEPFRQRRVEEVMTRTIVSVSPEDSVIAAAELMRQHRIRHLPVLQGENLLGIVGIREVLGALVGTALRAGDETARETVHGLLSRSPR